MNNPPNSPNLDRVQQQLFAAIEKDGLRHTFEWMHIWFDKVARAEIDDELLQSESGHKDRNLRALIAMENIATLSRSATSFSSSASANLMKQARLSGWAHVLEASNGYGSRTAVRQEFDKWRAARDAAKNAAPSTEAPDDEDSASS